MLVLRMLMLRLWQTALHPICLGACVPAVNASQCMPFGNHLAGACLVVGPAQVLAKAPQLQLPSMVNLGFNAQGIHVMDNQLYRWGGCCWQALLSFTVITGG